MKLVIDTSVAIKWFVEEAGSELARFLAYSNIGRVAPDLVIAETANVLQRKVRAGELTDEQATAALKNLAYFFDRLVPSADLVNDAFSLSRLLDHSVYDCMYLALALTDEGAQLVTSDMKFMGKANASGFGHRIWNLDAAGQGAAKGQENGNG